jgi:hypothetical protein
MSVYPSAPMRGANDIILNPVRVCRKINWANGDVIKLVLVVISDNQKGDHTNL